MIVADTLYVHYPKIRRLPIYPVPYRKPTLEDREIQLLFSSDVVVEEKIDGKFSYTVHENYVIFYEHMEIRHHILYSKLPKFEIAFDVYDIPSRRFLEVFEKHEILRSLGWCYAPVIYIGEIKVDSWKDTLMKLMRRPSIYGADLIEGVVVKNYAKQFFAKAINREFDEAVKDEIHYTRRKVKEKNKMYHGEDWLNLCYPSCQKIS